MPEEDLRARRELNLIIACGSVFMALFILNYLDYIQRMQENNYLEWDVKTLTSGDYTVECDIGPYFYPKYEKEI